MKKPLRCKLTLQTRDWSAQLRTLGREAKKTFRLLRKIPPSCVGKIRALPPVRKGMMAMRMEAPPKLLEIVAAFQKLNRLLS